MGAIALSLFIVVTQGAAAYMHPLSEESVREAYFLGHTTNATKRTTFFERYTRHFPLPVKGPYVESIEFQTPYEQVVLRSWQHWNNYDAQEAERDYAAKPDLVVVRVLIYSTPTYPFGSQDRADGQSENLWHGLSFRVAQQQSIQPKMVNSRPFRVGRRSGGAREALLEFDAAQFSSDIVTVEVATPDGQIVRAEFDLDDLR
jgi:hypothetical protein